MAQVVGVRFKTVGKIYYFEPGGLTIRKGDHVIVETVRGVECGRVAMEPREIPDEEIVAPLKSVIRVATKADMQQVAENQQKEKDAYPICLEKIAKHNMNMNLVNIEYTFDRNKILFYFTADGRLDFRDLVKDLASVFKTRIELRQIGVRDEAKQLGGLGVCGRPLCCSTYLDDFQPVSIKMAKEQGLSLNPTKISGTCGRLMCCLKFEQDAYEDLLRHLPKNGAVVMTPDGKGTVSNVTVLRQRVQVMVENNGENVLKEYSGDEIKILKNPKAKQEAVSEELEKLE